VSKFGEPKRKTASKCLKNVLEPPTQLYNFYDLQIQMHIKANCIYYPLSSIPQRASNEMVWKVVKAWFLDDEWMASGQMRNNSM
jgi:hypothetical protein